MKIMLRKYQMIFMFWDPASQVKLNAWCTKVVACYPFKVTHNTFTNTRTDICKDS